MNAQDLDPRLKYIRELHEFHKGGKLRILIGAGTSIPSGFPTWDQLNLRLLEGYLAQERFSSDGKDRLGSDQIPELAQKLYTTLGREGAVDFVRVAQKTRASGAFEKLLAEALYCGRSIGQLQLRSVHRQIAAMARQKTPIYTTNFDPLFEKALAESSDAGEWLEHRHPGAGRFPAIQHIHGWVDPDGHTEGDVILAESQYFELAARPLALANTKLLEVFRGPLDAAGFPVGGGSLILGMSLSDANLRRILYFLSLGSLENAGPIRAVIQEDDPLLLGYADKHWRSRGLDLIPVRKFAEISTILRDIRYGVPADGQPQAWIEDSARSLKGIPIFDNGWQDQKHHRLAELRERIRTLFAIHNEEVVQLTFFVPLQPHQLGAGVKSISPEEYRKSQYQLYPILSSRKCRTGEAAQTYAADRQHNVNRGTANLIAAAAFVTGNIEEAFDDGGGDETGVFGPFKRDWRSALAVPMLARGEWVPSAVLLLTSNVAEPFWRRFGDRHDRYFSQLINEIDEAARRVLVS